MASVSLCGFVFADNLTNLKGSGRVTFDDKVALPGGRETTVGEFAQKLPERDQLRRLFGTNPTYEDFSRKFGRFAGKAEEVAGLIAEEQNTREMAELNRAAEARIKGTADWAVLQYQKDTGGKSPQGKIILKITIGPDGAVKHAEIDEEGTTIKNDYGLRNSQLRQRVLNAARMERRFAPQAREITIPFIFQNS